MPRRFTTIFIFLAITDFTLAGGGRRSLHQPYNPQNSSLTPSPSPEAQPPKQEPKHPFSTSTPNNAENDKPFFPSYSSPPPQPTTFPVTLPANISSLSVPHPPTSGKSFSGKLLAVILCLSLISLILIVVLLYVIHERSRRDFAENFNLPAGDDSSTSTYQKLSSPEIRPLPPLPRRNFSKTSRSSEEDEEDDEVFFSPRNSSTADSPDRKSETHIPGVAPPPPPPPPLPPLKLITLSSSSRASRKPVTVHSVDSSSPLITESSEKTKLKPLHWDKVRASSDRTMVWDQIKSSSFKLNEEMIETLFVANSTNRDQIKRTIPQIPVQENRVLDPKKSQNIAILLRALNVTFDEVCESLLEGNADSLGTELLESLMKMAPTKEEERKLKDYKDESPIKLGNAERFLKAVVDIPFAFKRVDAMLYITNFDSELDYLRKSFATLQLACAELKNSRMFLKLLEAVLKTGNRMNVGTNRGDARAFKLDTLLKLVDVKGADGKTTLLHFVVQEIIRSEGSRLSGSIDDSLTDVEFRKLGLQVVSGLSGELSNVKKAAAMDADVLTNDVLKLAEGIEKVRDVVNLNEKADNNRKFAESMSGFLARVEEELVDLQLQKDAALRLVRELMEYFHGDSAREEAHRLRIFSVVRDFLSILDVVCKDVGKINDRTIVNSGRQVSRQINSSVSLVFP